MSLPKNVSHWSISDVSHWLQENHFEEEIEKFKEHKIDGKALLLLEVNDIAELISKIGPRVKFRAKISQFFSSKINENKQSSYQNGNLAAASQLQGQNQRYNFIPVYPNQPHVIPQIRYQTNRIIGTTPTLPYCNPPVPNIQPYNYTTQQLYNENNGSYKIQTNTPVQANPGHAEYLQEALHYSVQPNQLNRSHTEETYTSRSSKRSAESDVKEVASEPKISTNSITTSYQNRSTSRLLENEETSSKANGHTFENSINDTENENNEVTITKEVNFKIKTEPIEFDESSRDHESFDGKDDDNIMDDDSGDCQTSNDHASNHNLKNDVLGTSLGRQSSSCVSWDDNENDVCHDDEYLTNYIESNNMYVKSRNHSNGEITFIKGLFDDGYESMGNLGKEDNQIENPGQESKTKTNINNCKNENETFYLQDENNGNHSDTRSGSMVTVTPKYIFPNEVIDVNEYINDKITKQDFKPSIEMVTNRLALKERSKIFRRSEKKWHIAVNETAFQLVKKNPHLLINKKDLRLMAESEVRKTYRFAKGKSRSIAIPENRVAAEVRKKQKLTNDKISDMKRRYNSEGENISRKMRQCYMNINLAVQQSDTTKTRHLREEMQHLHQLQAKLHFRMDDLLYQERKMNGKTDINQVHCHTGTNEHESNYIYTQQHNYVPIVPNIPQLQQPSQIHVDEKGRVIQLTNNDEYRRHAYSQYNGDNHHGEHKIGIMHNNV